jgi:hypothetical protein
MRSAYNARIMELWRWIVAFWNKLSPDGKAGAAIGMAGIVITAVITIGVEYYKSEGTHPGTESTPSSESKPQNPAPKEEKPEEPKPGKPRIQYVPLPNVAPMRTPNTLVTAIPAGEEKPLTVDIGGEQVPVMTQAEVDQILIHKVDLNKFVKTNSASTPLDVWVTVGKDGTVQSVENASNDTALSPDVRDRIEQWKFKPFEINGEHVAVQTVIQLDNPTKKAVPVSN